MEQYFAFLDGEINTLLGIDAGFTTLPATQIYTFDPQELQGFYDRYRLIVEFQQQVAAIFSASLRGEMDPFIATLLINELPYANSAEHHRQLHQQAEEQQLPILPVFFRTDEVAPGKISEIQCPGSAWCICEQLHSFYRHFATDFAGETQFPIPPAQRFAEELRQYLPFDEPIVHHLLDNASIQAGMRYFLQRTRAHGLKYYGYDKGVTAYDCNFIRAHAFQSLLADNYLNSRLQAWGQQKLSYDLPPSICFDEKLPLILPFWDKTRGLFSDEIRDLFPYTSLITPDGMTLEEGQHVSLDEFFALPRDQKQYILKYSGSDLAWNWGSKGVYFAATLAHSSVNHLKSVIREGFDKHHYWTLQKKHSVKEDISFIDRTGEIKKAQATAKYSGFYGPSGLIAILNMHRPFYKVHGTDETVVSIC
jgi:hypothetical protein